MAFEVSMIFGDGLRPASTISSSEWIEPSCLGAPGTVGGLIPNRFESVLRIWAPPSSSTTFDFWAGYRQLFEIIATAAADHTSAADQAWFAIWKGHGYHRVHRRIAWSRPPADDEEQRAREVERARLEVDNRRRTAAIRDGLATVPRFDRPDRSYYLLQGPVSAVATLRYPDGDAWRNPDLIWPDDRSWFVGTDVDFWSLYIGGSNALITELVELVPTRCEPVALETPLEQEE